MTPGRSRHALMVALAAVVATAAAVTSCTGTNTTQVEVRAETTLRERSTTTQPPDCAQMLPAEAQASQLLMTMASSPEEAAEAVAAGRVGGFALTGNQMSTVGDQIAEAVTGAPIPVTVASDEEGGSVQRLRLAAGEIPSAAAQAETSPADAATVMGEHAARIKELGVTMNFAPVADVGTGSDLGSRTYGDDPATVSNYVEAVLPAISGAGVVPVVKHWPGIGSGSADPHDELTTVPDIAELRAADLVPFDRAIAAGAPAIMVTHAAVPGLTGPEEPATLSRAAVTGELRGRQGFDGLVITDDLSMGAITDLTTQDEAAELAVAAGADVALIGSPDEVEVTHARLVDAINGGRIPEEQVVASVRRVLASKGITGPCLDVVARYSALQREGVSGGDGAEDGGDDGTGTTDQDGSSSSGDGSGTSSDGDGTAGDGGSVTSTSTAGGPTPTVVLTGPPTTRAPGSSGSSTTSDG